MKIIILAAFLFSTLNSFACSCPVFPKIEEVVKSAELILQGRVAKHFEDTTENYSINRVYRVLKDTIQVRRYFDNAFKIQTFHSRNSSAACGVNLKAEAETDYIVIFPTVEKSEFGHPKPPLYVGVSSCQSYLYVLNKGHSADQYRYILSLLEK